MAIQRQGHCLKCARCCNHFIILSGAVSSFIEARKKYGLKLILNPDGKTFHCNMLDSQTKLCKIYENRPNACRTAPVKAYPDDWNCGYKFVNINNKKKELEETKKAINYFTNLPKKMEGNPDA
jgi:Fe-S-cluster containining protein